ncbi:hypothetical protein Tco_1291733 [Tanacetum coccineum]
MSSSSTVTYTSVYTDSDPWRVFWGANEELSDGGSPRVIVYGYDGLPMQPHPPSTVEVTCVPEPEYPEYLVPSNAEAPLGDQPLPGDALPTALSPSYDDDDEPSDDDDDEDEEPFEDEDDDEEEEEHLALADSSVVPVVDPVPSAGDTEAFETDESAPIPRSPQIPSPPLPPPPLSLHLPSPVPTSFLLPSSPLPPLLVSLFIPPPIDRREDIPEAELPPRKRLCLTALTSRIDYGFIGTLDAKTRHQRAEEVGNSIRDVWVDLTEVVKENNMPPRRSSATARAVAAARAPMTAVAVEKLIEARVSAALAYHDTLRNITNGHGDESHNSDTGIDELYALPMESVFHIKICAVENQVKLATCTFLGNALTWWNSLIKTVTQDVAYAMDWKALKKMMTVKYCLRGEIKKIFHKESEEVKKYVGGLPDMIQGNVMSYQPKTMEKAIEFAND